MDAITMRMFRGAAPLAVDLVANLLDATTFLHLVRGRLATQGKAGPSDMARSALRRALHRVGRSSRQSVTFTAPKQR